MRSYEQQLVNLARRTRVDLKDACIRAGVGRSVFYKVFRNSSNRLRHDSAMRIFNEINKIVDEKYAARQE
jgi:hypothetical protein